MLSALALPGHIASASCYRWTDGGGVIHLTDQPQLIPAPGRATMRIWTCRAAGSAGDDGASRLEQSDGGLGREALPVSRPRVLDPKVVARAGLTSSLRFLANIERRIHWGEEPSATELMTYNSVKRSLRKRGGVPIDGLR